MNIKLLYFLINNNYSNICTINSNENINTYLNNLLVLLNSKKKELEYINYNNLPNANITNLIKELTYKHNNIQNIISNFRRNNIEKIDNLNNCKNTVNLTFHKDLLKKYNNYISNNILYYNHLLNSKLIWFDYKILNNNYNIEEILDILPFYISVNKNILCMINYNNYYIKYFDYIVLEFLNKNKWDLELLTNNDLTHYINNKIKEDLCISDKISINFISNKIDTILKYIKSNIKQSTYKSIPEIIFELNILYNYIILDFNVPFWEKIISNILNKKTISKIQSSEKIQQIQTNSNNLKNDSANYIIEDDLVEDDSVEDELVEDNSEEDKPINDSKEDEEYDLVEDDSVENDLVEDDSVENDSVENDLVENDLVEDDSEEDNSEEDEVEDKKENIENTEQDNKSELDDYLLLPDNIEKPSKYTNKNSIQFSYKNDHAWLSLIWPDVSKKIIKNILINYKSDISDFKLKIKKTYFDNIISYIYIKKLKYITDNFIKDNDFLDIEDILSSIMDTNNKLIPGDKLKTILGNNLDKNIRKQLDNQDMLDLFDEILYDWNLEKIDIIRKGIFLKFKNHNTLQKALLNTSNKYLVDLDDSSSNNIIGILLMQTRYILSQSS